MSERTLREQLMDALGAVVLELGAKSAEHRRAVGTCDRLDGEERELASWLTSLTEAAAAVGAGAAKPVMRDGQLVVAWPDSGRWVPVTSTRTRARPLVYVVVGLDEETAGLLVELHPGRKVSAVLRDLEGRRERAAGDELGGSSDATRGASLT